MVEVAVDAGATVDREVDVDGLGSTRTTARVERVPPDESCLETAAAVPTPSATTSAVPAPIRVRCTAQEYCRRLPD